MTLSNEAHLSSQYQVCDNVDLSSIVQDFESYYFVRFQRHPKICKRVNAEEGPFIPAVRKIHVKKKPSEANNSQSAYFLFPVVVEDSKPTAPKTDPQQLGVTVTSWQGPVPMPPLGDAATDGNCRRKLKSLQGFKHRTTEWLEMAEVISKEIFIDGLDVSWDDIKGLEEPKRLLKEAVVYPIKYPALFQGVLSPWRGLLLFGPPGTGKTLLAKAVASESSTTFFNISASTIVSKWRGDSEKLVRVRCTVTKAIKMILKKLQVLFDLARYHAPSTIFLDEVEALASCRDSLDHEASRRLKTELLIQMDGLARSQDQVFLLATSNLPW